MLAYVIHCMYNARMNNIKKECDTITHTKALYTCRLRYINGIEPRPQRTEF